VRHRLVLAVVAVAVPALAGAADLPLAGRRLALRAHAAKRIAAIDLQDPALVPPFPDPREGASLIISGGAGAGQCRVEIPLDSGGWEAIRGDGPGRGYRYRKDAPGTQGVRRIAIRPGRIAIRARGQGWPCDLSAASERLPVTVVLRLATRRLCAAFDAPSVLRNTAGRFRTRAATAPAACPKTDLTVATLNVLHGLFCPAPSASCRLAERVDLLFQWIAARGCPDVVTLQEVSSIVAGLVPAHLATACPFPYQSIYQPTFNVDDEMILTRYPVAATGLQKLVVGFRHVLFARIDHPIGPVDVFSTHLASGSDGAGQSCASVDCPPECVAAGALTVRQCQGVQAANYVLAQHTVPTPAVFTGDFNESPGTFVYQQLTIVHPWLDTHLAAGNAECQPATGTGCTSGRADEDLSQLESPTVNENERIDYIFLVPPAPASLCGATLDGPTDGDGDGTATRLFADQPNPFAGPCGPAPAQICWPSDHEGAELDLGCD